MRAWWAALALLVCAPAAEARRGCGDHCPPIPLEFELSIGATAIAPEDHVFSGSGEPAGSDGKAIGPRMTLRSDGHALNLGRPVVALAQFHYAWLTPWHLYLGGSFGFFDGDSGRGGATVAGQTIGPGISGFQVGPELGTVVARGPLEIRAGVAFGYRSIEVPISSFVRVPCKGGTCAPQLSDDEFFFEPRVAAGLRWRAFLIGAYAGGDLMPGGGWSAGGFAAVTVPDWVKRAELHHE